MRSLVFTTLAAALLLMAPLAQAGGSAGKHGAMHTAEISGMWSFHDVVEILRAEFFHRGWTLQYVQDVDIALRDEKKLVRNKVLQVSHPEMIAGLMADHPGASLGVSQQIAVYQTKPERPLSYRGKPGEITVAVVDPGVAAKAMGLDGAEAVKAMRQDIKAVLDATVAFFSKTAE